jgi:multidrug transporter EmrE-like cation transporter
MTGRIAEICGYLVVGLLWGCTNPFIKHGQSTVVKTKDASTSSMGNLLQMMAEPKVLVPFLVNQLGSIAFFSLLLYQPISIASPVCNSLTFIITAITGYFVFGEEIQSPLLLLGGISLVLAGIYVCMTS